MTTSATTLPCELLFDCLDFAAIHPQNILLPDYRCLRTLSLVSKQVNIYAQKALFRFVYLSKNRHALAFGNAVDPRTEKGRWLANLVSTLKAQVRTDRGNLTQRFFIAALLACPKLQELDLDVMTGFDMSRVSNVLHSRASPIHTLRINAPSTIPLEFLRVFPSLKFVEFKHAMPFHTTPPGSPPTCKLAELHWPGSANDVLQWILSNSEETLEILHFTSPDRFSLTSTPQFEHLMWTHGASLRSLHVPALPGTQAFSLRYCTQLEEFILDSILTEAVLGKLPETVEHLQVQFPGPHIDPDVACNNGYGYDRHFLPQLTHYIETAPSLLTFTSVHESAPSLKALREPCERRGIVLREWSQPYGTFPGERQELGYVETFPRRLLLSPLRAREGASEAFEEYHRR